MRTAPLLSLVTVVALAPACGDDGFRRLPDGPPADHAPDGTPEPVSITVTNGTEPVASVVVVFQNADSTLVRRAMTDTTGTATAVMAAGGFVTVVNPFFNGGTPTLGGLDNGSLHTFAGVKPGDHLQLRSPPELPADEVQVSLPFRADTQFWRVWTTCGPYDFLSAGSGSSPMFLNGCAATEDVTVEAFGFNGESEAMIVKANHALGATLDLSAEAYTATPATAYAYTNIPAGVTTVNTTHFTLTANGRFLDRDQSADVTANAASIQMRRPAIAGSTQVTTSSFFNGSLSRHEVLEWGPQGAYQLNASNLFLEELASFPEYNTGSHRWAWTVAPGAAADLLYLSSGFGRPIGKGFAFWTWELVAPAGTSAAFPVLPGEEAGFNPEEGDDSQLGFLFTAKVPGGYDAIREEVLAGAQSSLVTGATGRVVLQFLDFGGDTEALAKRRARHPGIDRLRPAVRRR